jgi:SpoVK/Ycf46/Vps4 family AAA+-type ATPase
MDGVSSGDSERVLIMVATNKPDDLDEAILRRFAKKIFIPLPEKKVRISIILNLFKGQSVKFTKDELDSIGELTERYSASDLSALCKEMAFIPVRELGNKILHIQQSEMRPINYGDFTDAIKRSKPSCSQEALGKLKEWRDKFGQS